MILLIPKELAVGPSTNFVRHKQIRMENQKLEKYTY